MQCLILQSFVLQKLIWDTQTDRHTDKSSVMYKIDNCITAVWYTDV